MRRLRNVKIVATLGPASDDYEMIRALFETGADVFRLNMSHGTHDDFRARHAIIRQIEKDTGRPIAILADLQGPKLRCGVFADGPHELQDGQAFRFDLDETPGDASRVCLPHTEIFDALEPGATLLVNDGKIRLQVGDCGADFANCTVIAGGDTALRSATGAVIVNTDTVVSGNLIASGAAILLNAQGDLNVTDTRATNGDIDIIAGGNLAVTAAQSSTAG